MRIPAEAARQHGAFSIEQARAAGWDTAALARAVRGGRLVRLHRGVYADRLQAADEHCRLSAVLLCTGPGGVLGQWTAARLLALPIDRLRGTDRRIHVTIPHDHTRPRSLVTAPSVSVTRCSRLLSEDILRVAWLRCTRVERTLIDLAGALAPDDCIALVARCLQERRTTPSALRAASSRAPSTRSRTALDSVLRALEPGHQSVAEVRFAAALRSRHLPPAVFNARVQTPSGVFYPDAYWPQCHVVAEVAGQAFHFPADRWEADLARTAALAAVGITVLTVSWGQLADPTRCEEFFTQLERTLTVRTPADPRRYWPAAVSPTGQATPVSPCPQ